MAKFYDTILGEYIKNPGNRGLSLDDLALKYFEYKMISYNEVTNKKKLNFQDVDLVDASIYSGEDVYVTWELYKKQIQEEISSGCHSEYNSEKSNQLSDKCENQDFSILYNIEIPLLEVLKDMEIAGVKVDRDKLKGIGILLENEIASLEKEIHNLAGEDFNIKSPRQVADILFTKLGLSSSKKTKTGFSVDSEVLEELAKKHDIAKKIIDYRTYTKLLSTYIEGLIGELDDEDIIHTNYNQTIASTGRLSSTNPNLQNIPTGEGISGEIRTAFIPFSQDEIMLAFDYSQVEVRVLSIMSGDENLRNAFLNGIDIHYNTAKFMFGTEYITKDQRKIAKSVNFGVIYGISAFGLSKMIEGGVGECKKYIDKFYENYPKVREFFDKVVENCKETGYVETLFGRKRYIAGINDSNRIIAESAKREAINMPIQGTAADIIKLAMIEIHKFIKENNLKSKMIMQVHDELVFSVRKSEQEILEKNIKLIMENVLENSIKKGIIKNDISLIPLLVDVGIGKNRGEAK
ncbi:MAG: DNA polymerase [Candidatus Gracilibacteria bacterium]|nr:DNA polymerase [Candidatus Gracilibacteria bacterium]